MACALIEHKEINKEINNKIDVSDDTKSSSSKLIFPDFDTIKVSTKTFIVMTNFTLDINKLFNYLPITPYIVVPKRRGRKKKNEPVDPNKDMLSGSIITLEYLNQIRGVDLKKKTKKKKENKKARGSYFRNSVTVVMIIDDKKINFKVSRNGKFQMTGCKRDDHAEECVKWFWKYIKDSKGIYKFIGQSPEDTDSDTDSDSDTDGDSDNESDEIHELKAIFIPAMRNIDFGLDFFVDREQLDEYFNLRTDYHSLLETSFGYTGVNIKIPITKSILELQLKQITYDGTKWIEPSLVPYRDYLDMLPSKDVDKKLKKQRYNTFLVFHSGKVIMSGMEATFMKDVYYEFLDIIRECYDIIEERLEK
jgi:TATA-box binding protein (TBP) (component of TFIID and TFIIIB)